MRSVRILAAVLMGVAVAPLAAVSSARPAAADVAYTFTVSPTHGVWGAPFTVTYTTDYYIIGNVCDSAPVNFLFESILLGSVAWVNEGTGCTASVHAKLPDDPHYKQFYKPGPHVLHVGLGNPPRATYILDPDPSPTTNKSRAPTTGARNAGSPAGTAPSSSPTSAGPGQDATPSSVAIASEPVSPTALAVLPAPVSAGYNTKQPWIIAGLGLMTVGATGLFGLFVYWIRNRVHGGR